MKIDPRFPTKLDTVSDAPEPLRSELVKSLPSKDPVRLLVHAPAFPTGEEKSPATLLAVTSNGWLVASETEVRLADFQMSHQESDVLTLQLRASQGDEKLEITFLSDHENTVLKGMEQMFPSRNSVKKTT
jgi:hypothetical protein